MNERERGPADTSPSRRMSRSRSVPAMTGAIGFGIVNLAGGALNAGFVVMLAIVAVFAYYIIKYNRPQPAI